MRRLHRSAASILAGFALALAGCDRPAAGGVGAFCLRAEVSTGSHPIPALSGVSLDAMTRLAARRELRPARRCRKGDLTLRYTMTFDVQALRGHAKLEAVRGDEVVWREEASAALPAGGGFHYLAVAGAEHLLARFLDALATGGGGVGEHPAAELR